MRAKLKNDRKLKCDGRQCYLPRAGGNFCRSCEKARAAARFSTMYVQIPGMGVVKIASRSYK